MLETLKTIGSIGFLVVAVGGLILNAFKAVKQRVLAAHVSALNDHEARIRKLENRSADAEQQLASLRGLLASALEAKEEASRRPRRKS